MYQGLSSNGGAWYQYDGNKLLDLSGQTLNLSFGQPGDNVKKAVIEEIQQDNIFFSSRFGSDKFIELAQLLTSLAPPNLSRVNHKLTNGSDAVEVALKLGRQNTRSTKVLALKNAWHGETMATLALSDKVRGQYIGSNLEVEFAAHSGLEALLECACNRSRPSVVILDPIGFSSGLFKLEDIKAFLPELRRECLRKGHYLVFDEVQIFGGFLNGSLFSYDIFGVECDALAIGKALGQGFPISACLYDEKHAELLYNEAEFTHGGQPPACAAAITGIQHLHHQQKTVEISLQKWRKFVDFLRDSCGEISITELGFMCSLTPSDANKVDEIAKALFAAGLIVRKGNNSKSILLKAPINFDDIMQAWTIKSFNQCLGVMKGPSRITNGSWLSDTENIAIDYVEKLTAGLPSIEPYSRSIEAQTQLVVSLKSLGIPCPGIYEKTDGLQWIHVDGVSLEKYAFSSAQEVNSVLGQLMDHVIKAHQNGIIIGDRWPGNTIWDGKSVTLIDFDIGYTGDEATLMAFEHMFALFHHLAIVPEALARDKIARPYLFELLDRHGSEKSRYVFDVFYRFYGDPQKPANATSLAQQTYQKLLDEFATIIVA